jgi:triacylglycerol lipase
MPFTDSVAARLGLLAKYAEDMYADNDPPALKLSPPVARQQPAIAAGWQPVAYIAASDAVFPPAGTSTNEQFGIGPTVFYGFLAQSITNVTEWAVVIRGTDGLVEWVIDGKFVPFPHPLHAGAYVEDGFWHVFASMSLMDFNGQVLDTNAIAGVASRVGTGSVTVVGHSLGSALATYFSQALAEGYLRERVSACMFASPRTGNAAWGKIYDATVGDYLVVNYLLDLVPHVPTRPIYQTLTKVRLIEPATAQAAVKVDIFCNHHVICYCAMLDAAVPMSAADRKGADYTACVLGPPAAVSPDALVLAKAVTAAEAFDAATLGTSLKALDQAQADVAEVHDRLHDIGVL